MLKKQPTQKRKQAQSEPDNGRIYEGDLPTEGRGTPLCGRPVVVKDIDSARRLLSRLILSFQKRTVAAREAKDLTYLLISFVAIVKDSDIEKRIKMIEERMGI